MGWFSVYYALKFGRSAYGGFRETLRGECDPGRSLRIAIEQVQREILRGEYLPDRRAKARLAYWRRRLNDDLA